MDSLIRRSIEEHLEVTKKLLDESSIRQIQEIATIIIQAFENDSKVLICGNGGSAADAQHLAAEWLNRFEKERRPLPAIALTTDSSVLTSVANDYQYNEIFSKQVKALGQDGDVLIGITTSGQSENVLLALQEAKSQRMVSIAFCGENSELIAPFSDYLVCVPSKRTARIQETHILIFHILCELVDQHFSIF